MSPAVLVLSLVGCHRTVAVSYDLPERRPEVRFRPGEPRDEWGQMLLAAVPGGQWDFALEQAVAEVQALSADPTAVLDPGTQSLVLARAGFPSQARFVRIWNGGAFPAEAVDAMGGDVGGVPVDLALARRVFGDGTTLWVVAWARHEAELDPLPRDLTIDTPLAVRVDHPDGGELRLVVAPPTGPVEDLDMTSGVSRWVDRFNVPGAYRIEVLRRMGDVQDVVFLFTVWVDTPLPEPTQLSALPDTPPNPIAAEATLFDALNALRTSRGLAPVQWFDTFIGPAREHSALMAATGVVAHQIEGTTEGLTARLNGRYHPRATCFENVAAAADAKDAQTLVEDSPAHLRNLLCEGCTHAVIGAAIEPVLDRPPRLFVTWELLEFPNGPPRPIDHYDRTPSDPRR